MCVCACVCVCVCVVCVCVRERSMGRGVCAGEAQGEVCGWERWVGGRAPNGPALGPYRPFLDPH